MPKRLPPAVYVRLPAWLAAEMMSVATCPPVVPFQPDPSAPLDSSHVRMMMPFCAYQAVLMMAGMLVASHVSPAVTGSCGHGPPLVCMSSQLSGLTKTKSGGDALFRSVIAFGEYGTTL